MPSTKKQFVMLIWELWPEELKIFMLPMGTALAELARLSDGCYINGGNLSDDHPIFLLNEKLEEVNPFEGTSTKDQHITAIYRCGWYL